MIPDDSSGIETDSATNNVIQVFVLDPLDRPRQVSFESDEEATRYRSPFAGDFSTPYLRSLDSNECNIDRISVEDLTDEIFSSFYLNQRPLMIVGAANGWFDLSCHIVSCESCQEYAY